MSIDLTSLVHNEMYGRLNGECISGPLSTVKRVIEEECHYFDEFLTQNSSSELAHVTMLRILFSQKNEFRQTGDKPVFYDLGCGVGALVIYAAHDGWLGLGTEFDDEHYQSTLKNIDDAVRTNLIGADQAKIAYGNFFQMDSKLNQATRKWIFLGVT